jgi:hypothetical protein
MNFIEVVVEASRDSARSTRLQKKFKSIQLPMQSWNVPTPFSQSQWNFFQDFPKTLLLFTTLEASIKLHIESFRGFNTFFNVIVGPNLKVILTFQKSTTKIHLVASLAYFTTSFFSLASSLLVLSFLVIIHLSTSQPLCVPSPQLTWIHTPTPNRSSIAFTQEKVSHNMLQVNAFQSPCFSLLTWTSRQFVAEPVAVHEIKTFKRARSSTHCASEH